MKKKRTQDILQKKEVLVVRKGLVNNLRYLQKQEAIFTWDSFLGRLEVNNKLNQSPDCILGHYMGLSKTFQVITLVHTLITNKDATGIKPVLVGCPKNVILNWVEEFEIWQKLKPAK